MTRRKPMIQMGVTALLLAVLYAWRYTGFSVQIGLGEQFWYLVSPANGLLRRGMSGALAAFLGATEDAMRLMTGGAWLLVIAALVMIGISVIRRAEKPYAAGWLYLAFLAHPGALKSLMVPGNVGSTETYLLLFFLLICVCIAHRRLMFCVPILSGLALYMDERFLLLYFPMVCALCFVGMLTAKKRQGVAFAILYATVVMVGVSAFALYAYGSLGDQVYEVYHAIENKIGPVELWNTFFGLHSSNLSLLKQPLKETVLRVLPSLFLLIPLWLPVGWIWVCTIWQRAQPQATAQEDTQEASSPAKVETHLPKPSPRGWVYAFFPLTLLLAVPTFAFAAEWGRMVSAVFSSQLMGLLSLIIMGDTRLSRSLSWLDDVVRKQPIAALAVLVYLMLLPVLGADMLYFAR